MRLGGSVKNCTLPCGSQTWRPPSPPRPPRPGPVQSGSDYPNVVSKVRPDQPRARCALVLWGGLRGVHLRARAGVSGQARPWVWACGSAPRSPPSSALWDHGFRPRLAPLEGQAHSGWRFAVTRGCLVWWAENSQLRAAWRFEQASPPRGSTTHVTCWQFFRCFVPSRFCPDTHKSG